MDIFDYIILPEYSYISDDGRLYIVIDSAIYGVTGVWYDDISPLLEYYI